MFSDFKSTAELPAVESALAEELGRGRAILLARRIYFAKAGCRGHVRGRLYVPSEVSDRFVETVGGRDAAEALVDLFRTEPIMLSACDAVMRQVRDHAIRFLRAHGARVAEIARAARCSEKTIRRACRGVKIKERASDEFLAQHLRTLYAHSVVCDTPYIPVKKNAR